MKRLALILLFVLVALPASAANRFLTCATACTITASDTTIWGTTTGGTGASVPGSSDAVVLDGATCVGGTTCTATMGAGYNPTWQSITMGACTASTTGCIFDWSVNNNSPTLSGTNGFNGSGTGTRNLKMGSGTWTISNSTGGWNFGTVTNLTLSATSSTIIFSGTGSGIRTFTPGASLSYGTVTVNANSSGGAFKIAVNAATFATFNVLAPNTVAVTNGNTLTVTNALAVTGTSGSEVFFTSDSPGLPMTISSASSGTFAWSAFRDATFTGGGTFTATSSFNLGNNSGITITAPVTGGGGIIGGWLFRGDLNYDNDNMPMFLNKAA